MIRNLQWGSVGKDVEYMQGILNLHLEPDQMRAAERPKVSPRLDTDGKFGPKTDARVRYFQKINQLQVDGIVGQNTRRALLDFRTIRSTGGGAPMAPSLNARKEFSQNLPVPIQALAVIQSMRFPSLRNRLALGQSPQQPAPVNQPKLTSVVVQQGTQVNANPWFFSPLVLTAQANFFIRNNGVGKPFVISPGLQFTANQVGSPAGSWTGQLFSQFGAAEITDNQPIDWFNPFVQLALQKNAGQPFSLSLGVGDQVNWNLTDKPMGLSLFVNGQVVTSVDLSNGLCSAPAVQILGGVSFEFVLLGNK